MIRVFIAATACAVAIAVAASAGAAPVEDARDVASFTKLQLDGAIDVTVRAGEPQSVVIVTEADQQPEVSTEVRGDTLVIKLVDRRVFRAPVRARISVPALEGIRINGSSDTVATGIDSDSFAVEINGSGDVELAGRCGRASVGINGSGNIDARALRCRDAAVGINGSGDARLYASGSIDVELSGSGDIDLWGGGRIAAARMSGSGDLETHPDGQ